MSGRSHTRRDARDPDAGDAFSEETIPAGGDAGPEAETGWDAAAAAAASGDPGIGRGASRGDAGQASDVPGGTVVTDPLALAAERDDYLGALQRMKADFDNFRKRVDRMREEQSARAALDLVSKLLPVLDTLDLAAAHARAGKDPGPDAVALDQARSQLLDVLGKEGLERLGDAEVLFDPSVHDAVAHAPAAEPEAAVGDLPESSTEPERADADADADTDTDADASGSPRAVGSLGRRDRAEPLSALPPDDPWEFMVERDPDDDEAEADDDAADADGVADAASRARAPRPPRLDAPGETVVDEVLRSGYRWRGQVIRPAMVRVRG